MKKPNKEAYGESAIQLVEVEMTDDPLTEIDVDGTKVLLHVLNAKKFDPNCHCYALIETLKLQYVTMVDLIYSYGKLDTDVLNDKSQLKAFFESITRYNINCSTGRFPGIIHQPKDPTLANYFKFTLFDALQEANNNNFLIKYGVERKRKKKVKPSADEIKDDGLLVELMKTFYESITLSKVKRPTDSIEKTVSKTIKKKALLLKCGTIITAGGVENGKYFATFRTGYKRKENDVESIPSYLDGVYSLHIAGVDDEKFVSDPDYRKKFGEVFLQADILETLFAANGSQHPRFLYAGEYNEDDERMELGEDVGQAIKKLNDAMFPKNKEKSGEGR